ncbi:MAG TPA: hypothetical protein VGP93_02720 [Polyangiaceae bacterium]|nr:hypothetical protein [Polyangiaceae bacterium]
MAQSPIVLHVVRPYQTAEEYLAAEAWSIDARSMVLIGAADLAPDTVVLFDVAIESGDKLIRAEGKVAGMIAAAGERPAGLRVKLKRYGAATKAFIDRAAQIARGTSDASSPLASIPLASGPASLPPIVTRVSVPDFAPPPVVTPPSTLAAPPEPTPPSSRPQAAPASVATQAEPSGVHRRPVDPVDVPANREALLSRLRERARSVDLEAFEAAAHKDRTA